VDGPADVCAAAFLACVHEWEHSFTRLWPLARAALWRELDVQSLLEFCGTTKGSNRYLARPEQAYFVNF